MASRVSEQEVMLRIKWIEENYNVELKYKILKFNGSKSIIEHQCTKCSKIKQSNLKNLLRGIGFNCRECSMKNQSELKKIPREEIYKRIRKIDNEIIEECGYSSEPEIKFYNGSESIIEHKCLKCGKLKESNFGSFKIKSGLFCRNCSYEKMASNMTNNIDVLINNLFDKFGDCNFIVQSDYNGRNTIFLLNCKYCLQEIIRSYDSLIMGYALCNKCSKEQTAKKLAISEAQVRDIIERENCKWISGIYENNRSKLEIQCRCGRTYKCSLAEFKDGQTLCSNCSKNKSLGERLIEEVIYFYCEKFHYKYKYQKTFPNLKGDNGESLRFDFVIYNKTRVITLFEYNGIQHYEYVPYFHKTFEKFLKCKRYDLMKINYCLCNNYNLTIIKHTQLLELQNILIEELGFTNKLKEEFYEKLSDIKLTLWRNSNILVFTIYKEFIGLYSTISEAQYQLSHLNINISHSDISNCLSGKRNQTKKLIFIKDSDLDKLDVKIEHLKKYRPSLFYKVKLIPIDNNNPTIILSVAETKSKLDLNKSSHITQVCHYNLQHNNNKHALKGYICEWIDYMVVINFTHILYKYKNSKLC